MTVPLTTDEQELLRLAAKACGREPDQLDEYGAWFRCTPDPVIGAWTRWNPLRVDGDAFGLALTLAITVEPYVSVRGEAGVRASRAQLWHVALVVPDRDACASARLAITECAAEIARYRSNKDTTP